jgi:hypothetical protein
MVNNDYTVMHVRKSRTSDIANAAVKHKGQDQGTEDDSKIHTAMRSLKSYKNKQSLQSAFHSKCYIYIKVL